MLEDIFMTICPEPEYTRQPYSHDDIGDWVFSPVLTRYVGGDFDRSLDERCVIPFNSRQGVSLFAVGGELIIAASLLVFVLLTRWRAKRTSLTFWKRTARIMMWILVFYVVAVPVVTMWRTLRG